eukprot:TRINITY_DN5381_c0_g1_i1.p1 TRINITY_DN5381_c0_g1~~TRINITY_DN5381_c0_g1_i1.p1  ORF type:complete len:1363 (+),score=368.70 TRINITY_DN5381_c0_g1_i1:65-4153(+)
MMNPGDATTTRNGASHISSQLLKDGTVLDLFETLTAAGPYDSAYMEDPTQFVPQGSVIPIPEAILSHYSRVRSKSFMGLFPEIKRAWITIDNKLFLWNYEDGNDYYPFDGLDQIIVSVALIPPRPNVFQQDINYILAISTPVEIVLLAVRIKDTKKDRMNGMLGSHVGTHGGELTLHPTQLAVSSDNINMVCMVGTPEGRIFMCGQDGCLYELTYQAATGWFSGRCAKINHSSSLWTNMLPAFIRPSKTESLISGVVDRRRRVLYTLSARGRISVYDLGQGGAETILVAALEPEYLAQELSGRTGEQWTLDRLQIVTISPILDDETKDVHLIAITSSGYRMYFSTNRTLTLTPITSPAQRPFQLKLIHVRPGPPAEARPTHNEPRDALLPSSSSSSYMLDSTYGASRLMQTTPNPTTSLVSAAYYSKGVYLLARGRGDERDTLVSVCPDPARTSRQDMAPTVYSTRLSLYEMVSRIGVDGKVWSIEEDFESAMGHPANVSELSLQVYRAARKFLCLTTSGIHVVLKQRPLDQLADILITTQGLGLEGGDELTRFVSRYGNNQACAQLLAVACQAEEPLCSYATRAFFKFGGRPQYTETGITGNINSLARAPGSVAPGAIVPVGSYPMSPAPAQSTMGLGGVDMGRAVGVTELAYSSAHNGLSLHLARIVRPLWDLPLVAETQDRDASGVSLLVLPITHRTLREVIRNLNNLRIFLEKNPTFAPLIAPAPSPATIQQRLTSIMSRRREDEARRLESRSLSELHQVSLVLLEATNLLSTVGDAMHRIMEGLPHDTRARIISLRFKDIVGSEVGAEAARTLVHSYMGLVPGNSDAVGDLLARECPSFFSASDRTLFQGSEMLQRALGAAATDAAEQTRLLQESLSHFSTVASSLTLGKLSEICGAYQSANFFGGVLELVVRFVRAHDGSSALQWYRGGQQQGAIGERAYQDYMAAMQNVLDLLASTAYTEKGTEFRTFIMDTLSKEELVHVALFGWYLEKGLEKELITLPSPYLENYLRRSEPDSGLLWQYLLVHHRYLEAAIVLSAKADQEGDLSQRVEALAQARAAVSGVHPTTPEESDLIHELMDRTDVAALQQQVHAALKRHLAATPQDDQIFRPKVVQAISELDSQLLTISALYNNYTTPFRLYDQSLGILHTARHKDPALVKQLWLDIIAEELAQTEPDTRSLADRIALLGKDRYPNTDVVMIDFLVDVLEQRNLAMRLWEAELPRNETGQVVASGDNYEVAISWVARLMIRGIGVPYQEVYRVYTQLLQTSHWQTKVGRVHLIEVLHYIIKEWSVSMSSSLSMQGGRGGGRGGVDQRTFDLTHLDSDLERFRDEVDGLDKTSQQLRNKLETLKKQLFP